MIYIWPSIVLYDCSTNKFSVDFERTNNLIMVIWYKNHWIVATNIDAGRSQSPISADKIHQFWFTIAYTTQLI